MTTGGVPMAEQLFLLYFAVCSLGACIIVGVIKVSVEDGVSKVNFAHCSNQMDPSGLADGESLKHT